MIKQLQLCLLGNIYARKHTNNTYEQQFCIEAKETANIDWRDKNNRKEDMAGHQVWSREGKSWEWTNGLERDCKLHENMPKEFSCHITHQVWKMRTFSVCVQISWEKTLGWIEILHGQAMRAMTQFSESDFHWIGLKLECTLHFVYSSSWQH